MPKAGWFERFLPRSQSKAVFLFVMTCYSLTITAVEARVIRLLGLWPEISDPVTHVHRLVQLHMEDNRLVIVALLGAPIVESFVFIGIIELLRRLRLNTAVQVIVPVSLFCFLHSIPYHFYGFWVAPFFLISAGAYVYWRRVSFWIGAEMIILLHFFSNAMAFLSVVAERLHR